MRENSNGRDNVPAWRVSQRVYGAIDGVPGTVVYVDATAGIFTVKWTDGTTPVVYPMETAMVRGAYPWE